MFSEYSEPTSRARESGTRHPATLIFNAASSYIFRQIIDRKHKNAQKDPTETETIDTIKGHSGRG